MSPHGVSVLRALAISTPRRELWRRRLTLRDALTAAELSGCARATRRLEEELRLVTRRLFPERRDLSRHPRLRPAFAYKIPLVLAETGQVLGYLIADQDGVHTPAALVRPLPQNEAGRAWLRALAPATPVMERARRAWQGFGHRGRPRCPGCRRRVELCYLEFRNVDAADRPGNHPALAVCDAAALELLDLSRKFVFGVSAVGTRVPFPCASRPPAPQERAPEPLEAGVPAASRRGKHRNPRSLANLIPNARGRARGTESAHSLRVESA